MKESRKQSKSKKKTSTEMLEWMHQAGLQISDRWPLTNSAQKRPFTRIELPCLAKELPLISFSNLDDFYEKNSKENLQNAVNKNKTSKW